MIVVVVIAILAAITIVSYNGITNRANASAAASLAATMQKKTELFAADGPTGAYPRALSDFSGGSAGTTTITGVTSRPATSSDSWYLTNTAVTFTGTSNPTSTNGKTAVRYTVCGHQGSTTAPSTLTAATTLTGVEIRYFNFDTGSGTKSVTIGDATAGGATNTRACFDLT